MSKPLWTPPPNWPPVEPGWSPAAGCQPPAQWGPAPVGWVWWQQAPRSYPPFWQARSAVGTSSTFKKGMAGLFVVVMLMFAVGAAGGGTEQAGSDVVASGSLPSADPSPEASAEPSPSAQPSSVPVPPTTDEIIAGADDDTALATLGALAVKGRASQTGYSREAFGQRWADTDRNGCDTRNDVLKRDLTGLSFKAGMRDCKVMSGTLADPYTGRQLNFTIEDADAIQIDHVVALSDAWQKGAGQWEPRKRGAFANDPLNLLAVDGPTNGSKSDGDAATWLPPDKGYRCAMVARQTAVKAKYDLWITAAERDAIARVLVTCPAQAVPTGGSPTLAPEVPPARPAVIAPPVAPAAPQPPAEPAPVAPAPASQGVTPGAFCSPEGATGIGKRNGKPYTCTREPGEQRARWRQ